MAASIRFGERRAGEFRSFVVNCGMLRQISDIFNTTALGFVMVSEYLLIVILTCCHYKCVNFSVSILKLIFSVYLLPTGCYIKLSV